MPLVLSTVNNDNLGILTNIFESLYAQFRLHNDMQMLKFVKQILEKLRTEQAFRVKKVKSSGLIIPSPNELVKLKGAGIDEMRRKIRLQIISDAMAKNGVELEDFAKKVDIKVEPKPVEQEDLIPTAKKYSITELVMSSDPISEPQRLRQLVELSKTKRVLSEPKEDKTPSVTELAMNADTLSNPLALKKLVEAEEDAEEEEQ